MAFTAPWVLVGLVAAAVPILLHLFARREPPTVEFPAVRYLAETARSHHRRLTLQNLLLLLVRTLLIVALVLAAAGPIGPRPGAAAHAPAALVVVLDNSPSSAVTRDGTAVLEELRAAAQAALGRATAGDALWLVAADLVPRRGSAAELRRLVDSLGPSPLRLDLGRAVSLGRQVLAGEARPGEILVLSDVQETALTQAAGLGTVVVARPEGPAQGNAGVAAIETGPQPWTAGSRPVVVRLAGTGSAPVPVTAEIGGRPGRQGLAIPNGEVTLNLAAAVAGWSVLRVAIAPDEFRADDQATVAIRVAPPAAAACDPAEHYLSAACDVLRDGGRLATGHAVSVGPLGPGASVVLPPDDPVRIGAVNRLFQARGISWRYGLRVAGPAPTDSGPLLGRETVTLRHVLESAGGNPRGVLITVGGAPWVVRTGNVIIIGSRLDPAWTSLPLSAAFVPFLDVLINRLVRGDLAIVTGVPGESVSLPDEIDVVATADRRWRVEGGAGFRAPGPGAYFLLRQVDTVGALNVLPDSRESRLDRADDRTVRSLLGASRIVSLDRSAEVVFAAGARGDWTAPLLWLALLLGLGEVALAGGRRSTS
jgi:hypothetical protein